MRCWVNSVAATRFPRSLREVLLHFSTIVVGRHQLRSRCNLLTVKLPTIMPECHPIVASMKKHSEVKYPAHFDGTCAYNIKRNNNFTKLTIQTGAENRCAKQETISLKLQRIQRQYEKTNKNNQNKPRRQL